jgi:hypothetical protein
MHTDYIGKAGCLGCMGLAVLIAGMAVWLGAFLREAIVIGLLLAALLTVIASSVWYAIRPPKRNLEIYESGLHPGHARDLADLLEKVAASSSWSDDLETTYAKHKIPHGEDDELEEAGLAAVDKYRDFFTSKKPGKCVSNLELIRHDLVTIAKNLRVAAAQQEGSG